MSTCEECLNSFWRFFTFKQKIRRNVQLLDTKLIAGVNEFLRQANEDVVIMDYMKCLLLVPASKENFVNNVISSNQFSAMETDPQEVHSKPVIFEVLQEMNPPSPCKEIKFHPTLDISDTKVYSVTQIETPTLERIRKRKIENSKPEPIKKRNRRSLDYNNMMHDQANDADDKPNNYVPIRKTNSKSKTKQSKWKCLKYNMSLKEMTWLRDEVANSKVSACRYRCTQCHRYLSSYASIYYHIASKHIVPRDSGKVWVSERIQQGKKLLGITQGTSRYVWNCVECSRVFNNEPGLRYHLNRHLETDYAEAT